MKYNFKVHIIIIVAAEKTKQKSLRISSTDTITNKW